MVEKLEILLLFDIDLDKSKNVSPDSFHRFDHVVLTTFVYKFKLTTPVVNQLTNALRVQFVNFDQVRENVCQISQVRLSHRLGYFLINFDHEIDTFYNFRSHQIVTVSLVGPLNDHLPVLISVFQEFLEILDLLVLFR